MTGEINDNVVTDNGVVAAVYTAFIYATGSSPARTRLYKMGINRYFDIAEADFNIYGELENEWELYIKGKNYHGFIVQRKKL